MKRKGCGKLLRKAMSLFLCASLCLTVVPDTKLKADESTAVYIGDVDGNGSIDGKDVTTLRRYVAGGWNVTVDEKEADINGDGEIDSKDITMLRRYLAGGWGVELRKKANQIEVPEVEINEDSFPDQNFRQYVQENIDSDDNGVLSSDEQLGVSIIFCNELDIKDFTGIELFKNLTHLSCEDNWLKNIDLSQNIALEVLDASYNSFEKLDLSGNFKLKTLVLYGFGFNLESLDLTNNTDLTELYYNDCNLVINRRISLSEKNYADPEYRAFLQTFDINKDGFLETEEALKVKDLNLNGLKVTSDTMFNMFSNLDTLRANELDIEYLTLSGIKIKKLDLSNSKIMDLDCDGNGLEELNINNTSVRYLHIYNNNLENLSFKDVPNLEEINCDNNKLVTLDVSNVLELQSLNCTRNNLTRLDLSNNAKLTNLYVDPDIEVIRQVAIDELTFDDAVFREYVKTFDTNNDEVLSNDELKEVKSIDISGREISSLKGISCFCYLESLDCSETDINILDVKQNSLKELNVSNTKKLEKLDCSGCSLQQLVLTGSAISRLDCYNNKLTELDVTGLPNLSVLTCFYNPITQLDLSKNPMLTYLDVEGCELTELDIKNNPELGYLCCCDTPLTKLLISNNPLLDDIDKDSDLIIYTDEEEYNKENSNEIYINEKYFPDDIFRSIVSEQFDLDDDGVLSTEEAEKVTRIDCRPRVYVDIGIEKDNNNSWTQEERDYQKSGEGIKSLKGIEYFINLNTLNCNCNQISELNLEKNIKLFNLDCSSNQLKNLSLKNNVELYALNATWNPLSSLDVSENVKLVSLDCSYNQIETLDISNNVNLTRLDCMDTKIETIDLSQNVKLKEIFLNNNHNLKELDVSAAKELTRLSCGGTPLNTVNLSNNPELETFSCNTSKLTSLDLSKNLKLNLLDCSYNDDLNELDLTNNTELVRLSCAQCGLKNINLDAQAKLKYLTISRNKLSSLDVRNLPELISLSCSKNNIKTLNVMFNPNLTKDNITCDEGVELIFDETSPVPVNEDTFPDAAFRKYVLENIDTDSDELLSEEELSATEMTVRNMDIHSFAGIEFFQKLTMLDCSNDEELSSDELEQKNEVEALNLIYNKKLRELKCSGIGLRRLEISECTELETLVCSNNQLQNLDVSRFINLKNLYCSNNQLQSLDISESLVLEKLICDNNQLKKLIFSEKGSLDYLDCSNNQLENLNQAGIIYLHKLYCSGNKFSALDLCECKALTWVQADDIPIKRSVTLEEVYHLDNGGFIEGPFRNAVFREYLAENFDLNQDRLLSDEEIKAVTSIDVSFIDSDYEVGYYDLLDGVELFYDNIVELNCRGTKVKKISLMHIPNLVKLDCRDCEYLNSVYIDSLGVTELDFSGDSTLEKVDIHRNDNLKSIVLNDLGSLKFINCSGNHSLENINASGCSKLSQYLFNASASDRNSDAGDISESTIDLKGCTSLTMIAAYRVKSLDISDCISLKKLELHFGSISTLDTSSCESLETMNCTNNQLTSLDLSKNINLCSLDCRHNKLKTLDVSKTKLEKSKVHADKDVEIIWSITGTVL